MKYAVMTFMFSSWWKNGSMSHEQILAGIAEAGAQGVEPFHLDFINDHTLLKRYRKCLDENGLTVPAVDVMCNLVHADRAEQTKGRDALRAGLDVCHALGAKIAHVAGHRLVPGVTPQDGRKMIADGLLEAAEHARAGGMTLAIEDFCPSPDLICSAADCLEILDLAEGEVSLVFDTGNFIAVGEQADETFDLMADHICHCHFKDFIPAPDTANGYSSCDLGQGVIPNAAVARKLLDRGYDQWIALETYGRSTLDPVSAVKLEMPVLEAWFES